MSSLISITDKEFELISDYIKNNYGVYLKSEKKILLEGRLHNNVEGLGFHSYSEYYNYLISDKTGKAAADLVDKITTNHTFFMREPDHFYFFRDTVLPFLVNNVKDRDLRIWCSACSTGEEAYTLAMIIDEFLGENKKNWDAKILATDISNHVLNIANKGIYSSDKIEPIPTIWKLNYFKKLNSENYIVSDRIKNEVIFRKFNLMEHSFPFKKKFHVIFCRNAMIYFDSGAKKQLVQHFYDSLDYGGFLFIGHSETIDRSLNQFKYVMPSVCQKR